MLAAAAPAPASTRAQVQPHHPALSPAVSLAVSAAAAVLPGARRHTLPGQDHAVDPSVLVPVLRGFFAG